MLVSFIIPSYNSADTIRRCLDSIYALTLKQDEFEVIFVDDCSSDETCDIVAEYQTIYPNITLLRQPKNNRQGAARNRGISVATGEYICFVDSDDVVKDGVVAAIRMAKEKQTDMTAFHTARADERGHITEETKHPNFTQGQIFTGVDFQIKNSYWCSGPVAYIYNRDFLNKVNYPFAEGVLYEDADFVMAHLYHAKNMYYSPDFGYLIYYRQQSTTRSITYKNISDFLFLGVRMLALNETIIEDIRMADSADKEAIERFAESVLDGACWNVALSFRRLFKLKNIAEVRAFYERFDAHTDRRELYEDYRIRKYYWNAWSALALKHRRITTALIACVLPFCRVYLKLK